MKVDLNITYLRKLVGVEFLLELDLSLGAFWWDYIWSKTGRFG
jgi:hypothetical protein